MTGVFTVWVFWREDPLLPVELVRDSFSFPGPLSETENWKRKECSEGYSADRGHCNMNQTFFKNNFKLILEKKKMFRHYHEVAIELPIL